MQKILSSVTALFRRLKAHIPSALPRSKEAFNVWFEELTEVFNLPNGSDYKQAVATCIMHLPELQSHKSMAHFARAIRKSMANQIAYNVIDGIRKEDIAKAKAQLAIDALKQLTEGEAATTEVQSPIVETVPKTVN